MDAFESDGTFPKLDPIEKRLLEFIAIKERDGKTLLVGDVIYLNDIGSPAALHRPLKRLKDLDLVRYGEESMVAKNILSSPLRPRITTPN